LKGEAEAKVAQGQKLAQQHYCSSCHGAKLQGQKHVPRLSGQSTDYFSAQLRNLRSGARADMDGTMASAAKALSDDEIEALAVYARSLD
jgi:cytochrome c553